MKDLRGRGAVVTGAGGGLGPHLARALGRAGVRLMLTSLPEGSLQAVAKGLQSEGLDVRWHAADLGSASEREALVQAAEDQLGGVDILVNNAGVEFAAPYHELSEAQVQQVIDINLAAPLLLTRRVLPGMVARGKGHVVNVSSLAGKSGAAYQESYAATKAGLVAFTLSLRGTYAGSGVSASAICPGFVEVGIYARLKRSAGRAAPLLLGACQPERVARATVRAIVRDRAEVIINRYPVKPLLVLTLLFPSWGCRLVSWLGANDFFRAAAEGQERSG